MGIAYGDAGRSTTAPPASWDAVIHSVSPATTAVLDSPSPCAIRWRKPLGKPPGIHASHASVDAASSGEVLGPDAGAVG